jgi:lysophospholipid acyltransferase (LPLAT)-like uncharacterized protein
VDIWDRVKIAAISGLGYWVIRLFCATLRWQAADTEIIDDIHSRGRRAILAFWHGRIFTATYFFRNRGLVVMTSRNRDGEYIARVIKKFGYQPARGSSSRGSHGATIECLRGMKSGRDVGITIDGPRGPRYVAKPGAAYMARKSGNPVVPFSISAEKKWILGSWDHFQIPKPFSRVVFICADPIYVDADASDEQIGAAEAQIQRSLEELVIRGDTWWGGNPDR